MAEQLGFDLPVRTARGREDFMISPANALALAMIDDWRNWPRDKLVLSGPEGSGKTHLVHVWAEMARARILPAPALAAADPTEIATGPLAIDDVPEIAEDGPAQTVLFHIHNMLAEAGHALLMTGRPAPAHWRLSLPDLQSRVEAAGHAALAAPDDALLAALFVKLFADRQLRPRADVIPYLVTRVERSFAAAARIVAVLDDQSLAEKRDISRHFAARTLDKFTQGG